MFMSTVQTRFSRATARYLASIAHLENQVDTGKHTISEERATKSILRCQYEGATAALSVVIANLVKEVDPL